MAQFEITTTKFLGPADTIKWTNNYNTLAADILEAQDQADEIAALEALVLWDNVAIRVIEVRQVGASTGSRRNVFIEGERADADPAVQLPLFNCVRVTLIAGAGRPSLKYFRPPLVEVEVTGFNLTTGFTDDFDTNFVAPLVGLGYVCNQAGNLITGYEVHQPVQMRQLGWHRRSRPGFHRGYIPD